MNRNALRLLQTYMFRAGNNHNAVRTLKTLLNYQPITSRLKNDTVFDSVTQTAVAQFQRSKGLRTTGRMDVKTWSKIGENMFPAQINALSGNDPMIRQLLTFGRKSSPSNKGEASNISFVRNAPANSGQRSFAFPEFKIKLYVSAFAPFDWFGPFNLAKGDGANRRFGIDPEKSYRIQGFSEIIAVDTGQKFPYSVTRASDASTSTMWIPFINPSTQSECYINNSSGEYQPNGLYSESSSADYHLYGNDDAFFFMDNNPVSDIDIHPQVWFHFEPQADPNKVIMHATGEVIGDQFPVVEAFILDRNDNGVMLGVYQIDANDTPQSKLPGDKQLPMFKIDLRIMVEKGIFTGVFKNGMLISLAEHNNYYTNLPPVTGTPNPPEKVRPATHY